VWLPPTLRTLVVADGMGPAVASRTPHVDPPPLTLATNRAGGDSVTGTGPPAGSRPSPSLSSRALRARTLPASRPRRSALPARHVVGRRLSSWWPLDVCGTSACWAALVRDRTSRRPGRTIRVRQVMANAGDAIVKGLAGTGAPCGCATQREPKPFPDWTTRAFRILIGVAVREMQTACVRRVTVCSCPPCSQSCWRVTWHQEHCFHVLLAPRCGSSCRRWARWCWLGC